jgi:hypothetical protein
MVSTFLSSQEYSRISFLWFAYQELRTNPTVATNQLVCDPKLQSLSKRHKQIIEAVRIIYPVGMKIGAAVWASSAIELNRMLSII